MKYNYPMRLEQEDASVFLTFPDFPEIISEWSETELADVDAEESARDALLVALQSRVDYGDEIPKPSPASDTDYLIFPSLVVVSKLMLYESLRELGIPRSGFASKLGLRPTDANRLFDLSHESRSEQISSAFAALGTRASFDGHVVSVGSFGTTSRP